jgi:hypothetical protein
MIKKIHIKIKHLEINILIGRNGIGLLNRNIREFRLWIKGRIRRRLLIGKMINECFVFMLLCVICLFMLDVN